MGLKCRFKVLLFPLQLEISLEFLLLNGSLLVRVASVQVYFYRNFFFNIVKFFVIAFYISSFCVTIFFNSILLKVEYL